MVRITELDDVEKGGGKTVRPETDGPFGRFSKKWVVAASAFEFAY